MSCMGISITIMYTKNSPSLYFHFHCQNPYAASGAITNCPARIGSSKATEFQISRRYTGFIIRSLYPSLNKADFPVVMASGKTASTTAAAIMKTDNTFPAFFPMKASLFYQISALQPSGPLPAGVIRHAALQLTDNPQHGAENHKHHPCGG